MNRNKIVVIEDEPDIVEVVSYNLKREGYNVMSVDRGDEGINLIRNQSRERIVIQNLVIDVSRHEVRVNNEMINLTAPEFKILHQLASQAGRAFTREQLLNRVVGIGVVVVDRNIDVHIRSVRKKLADAARLIQTIRGVGYRIVDS